MFMCFLPFLSSFSMSDMKSFNEDDFSPSVSIDYNVYSDYEETKDCVDGVVVYKGNDDYYLVETRNGYTILERYSNRLDEGDRIRGELNQYFFKDLLNRSKNSENKVYIHNFMLSKSKAVEWMGSNKHLKDADQRKYDQNK